MIIKITLLNYIKYLMNILRLYAIRRSPTFVKMKNLILHMVLQIIVANFHIVHINILESITIILFKHCYV